MGSIAKLHGKERECLILFHPNTSRCAQNVLPLIHHICHSWKFAFIYMALYYNLYFPLDSWRWELCLSGLLVNTLVPRTVFWTIPGIQWKNSYCLRKWGPDLPEKSSVKIHEVILNALFPIFQKSPCYIPIVRRATLWERSISHANVSKHIAAVCLQSYLFLFIAWYMRFVPLYFYSFFTSGEIFIF